MQHCPRFPCLCSSYASFRALLGETVILRKWEKEKGGGKKEWIPIKKEHNNTCMCYIQKHRAYTKQHAAFWHTNRLFSSKSGTYVFYKIIQSSQFMEKQSAKVFLECCHFKVFFNTAFSNLFLSIYSRGPSSPLKTGFCLK